MPTDDRQDAVGQRDPTVSIVIPAYNAARFLPRLVEACREQDYPAIVDVIVVDDGSTDETEQVAAELPCRLVRQPNRGPAVARNAGWRASDADIVCFTDSDCVPARGWVASLACEYDSTEVGGVGGTYDIANPDNLLASCIHEEIVERHRRMPKEVNYLGSFNLSYRRSVLQEVGGFDESFLTSSGEDNDLSYRVKKAGYSLRFTRSAAVAHYHPERVRRYLKAQYRHGYWRMKLYRTHRDMVGGDCYAGFADFLQPPLALLTLALLPFVWMRLDAIALSAMVVLMLLLNFPMAFAIVRRTGRTSHFLYVAMGFIRAYARGLGMAAGIVCSPGHREKSP